jgi:hypothetical protein
MILILYIMLQLKSDTTITLFDYNEFKIVQNNFSSILPRTNTHIDINVSTYDSIYDIHCRFERFMEAYNHVSMCIDETYKLLTKSSKHPLGGTAYLSLENTEVMKLLYLSPSENVCVCVRIVFVSVVMMMMIM